MMSGALDDVRMNNRQIRKYCKVDGAAESALAAAMQQFSLFAHLRPARRNFSGQARAHNKILKPCPEPAEWVARTIADLDGAEEIRTDHVTEAIQYRSLDRNLWA